MTPAAPDPEPGPAQARLRQLAGELFGMVRQRVAPRGYEITRERWEMDVSAKLAEAFMLGMNATPGETPAGAAGVPALLAAVEKVLRRHQPGRVMILGKLCGKHENHRHFSTTLTEADAVGECPYCTAAVYVSCAGCGVPVPLDECPDRLDIIAALGSEPLSGSS